MFYNMSNDKLLIIIKIFNNVFNVKCWYFYIKIKTFKCFKIALILKAFSSNFATYYIETRTKKMCKCVSDKNCCNNIKR